MKKTEADAAWFHRFNAQYRAAFGMALRKALEHVEDSGINLGVVFSPTEDEVNGHRMSYMDTRYSKTGMLQPVASF